MQDCDRIFILRVTIREDLASLLTDKVWPALHLQDWSLHVTLNQQVFCFEVPRLGSEDPQDTLKASHYDFILSWLRIVYICYVY